MQIIVYLWQLQTILILSGDIETNPGPTAGNNQYLTICHWNLNRITTDNFIKFPLLESYIATHKFDIICLSETFLDSSLSDDDPRLNLKGYSLIRSDHPNDIKQGGVCIYYKNHIPLIPKPAMTQLNECLVCELKVNNKKCFITVLYRSPSQSIETFDNFKKRLAQSCIDLIFTSQPNFSYREWYHASLFERCYHQIIYAKFNFKIHFPPTYERLIWDYSKENENFIRRSLLKVDWITAMSNLHVNDQVKFLTSCILNVFDNFVPSKTVIFKDKDPPWMNNKIRQICQNKAKVYKIYVKRGRTDADKENLRNITKFSANLIIEAKTRYLSCLGK